MAKKNGKKLEKKGQNMNQPNPKIKKNKFLNVESGNAVVPVPVFVSAPLTDPEPASTSALPTEEYRVASQTIETDIETKNHISGFIFMCNRSTKPECYQYRVFGLPLGKKEVVEAIKPGSKLFLFDCELKLLYGVYEATSAGTMNLEPNAFRGKFPAQVKFKIFKECLPLHESSFRHVLKENYGGRKFKQELSGKQVRNLLSSFRPLAASSQRAALTLPNVVLSRARPPLAVENQHLSGFIFMCNRSTKPECYQYRVFGLPLGKKEVVEAIKPGSKLFLFDCELKLLYGVYEATSAGTMNLEPNAFRGKFPAQVKFKIFKECLPLHESSFRHVLKENYGGRKFKQELSGKQVRNLLSSFRPLAASSQRAPPTLPNVVLSRARPPLAVEDQHAAGLQYYPGPPVMENWPLVHIPQHGYHGTVAYMEHDHQASEHRGVPGNNLYSVAESRQPHFSEGLAYAVQGHHPRYVPVQERGTHDQALGLTSGYHRVPGQVEVRCQDEMVSNGAYSAPSAQYASSVVQPQQVYSSAQYASSAVQPPQQVYSPTQYASSAVQQPQQVYSSTQYASSAFQQPQVYSSTQYASSAFQQPQVYSSTQYASSVVQPQQGYSSFPAPAVPYTESAVEPQAPASVHSQGSVPISSSYYMFSSPARVYH